MEEHPHQETSFKPLTVSLTKSGLSTPDQARITQYATERARLLLGCYRKGDANDPETYVAAITATLSRYPEDVICSVTHPASGLPIQKDFLPTVAEVYRACETEMAPRRAAAARERDMVRQKEEREEFERRRTTPEQDTYIIEGLRKLAAELGSNTRKG
jgi:hypothetical protein